MPASNELHRMGLRQAAAAIARRELSPVDLVEAFLARIETHKNLSAYAHVMAEEARAEAKQREAEAGSGKLRGPLHGVPVAVKDLCDTKGVRTAVGMPVLDGRIPTEDATVVRRLREAGAIIIGKAEMSEAALAFHHPDITAPLNPWGADLWCGSSSSGSGVAVAAELCMGAIGSDTGGSIRFPALCNGIVGIKPSWGRVSRHGVFPLSWTLDHVGPMARRVEDAAAMLGVIAGRDPDDATSLCDTVPDYAARLGDSLSGLRVGFDEAYAMAGVMEETKIALFRAIEILTGRGATLHAVKMPATGDANRAWTPICLSEAACVHSEVAASVLEGYGPSLRSFLDAGKVVTGAEYARANLARRQFAGNLNALFKEIDLMVVPVTGNAIPTVEEFAEICPDPEGLERLIYFTCLYDVSGHPTITLPAGLSRAGAPVALQLVGPLLGEETLCRAGHAFQQDFGWDGRPPLG